MSLNIKYAKYIGPIVTFVGIILIATHVFLRARKGKGLCQRLTLAKCGTNGDQIQRLMREPALIYFIQHVRKIDPSVISHLALYARARTIDNF